MGRTWNFVLEVLLLYNSCTMPLAPGTKLGPYEIQSPLGSGGMGEVYRAKDTRLDRSVAIKILPAHLSSDPARKQRFEREAKTISGLNHPNICTLHDVGSLEGVDYIVMECVEGESLAQRLEKGPMPANQVIKIGAELADALDKAHRNGVVHRDLKPANIMLTKSGTKLLDFGLAKPTAAQATLATLTSVAPQHNPVTQEGTIVGTFQYMSPEQIEGKELEGRSDIFSLGTVLYEMLTGQRAFDGNSQLSVASAILEKDPAPITAILPLTPLPLDSDVRRCLAKDPDDRWQTARDLALELQWLATPSASTDSGRPSTAPPRKSYGWVPWTIAALAVLAAISAAFFASKSASTSGDSATIRAAIPPPDKSQFASIETDQGGVPAVSPDGRYIVSPLHEADGNVRLWLRALQSTEGKILPGTEGSGHVFWAPDSHSIGFFAQGKLKRTDTDSGAVYNIADSSLGRGGSWNSDGIILFSQGTATPLFKVTAAGGSAPVAVTNLDPANSISSHRWPQFLPDGKHFLYIGRSEKQDQTGLYEASLDNPEGHLILKTVYNASYVPPGYLLFVRDESLFAQKFDASSMKLSGDPIPLPDRIGLFGPALNALFSASNNGVLAYYPGQAHGAMHELLWYDRAGNKSQVLSEMFIANSSLSPDGAFLALSGYAANEWIPRLWRFDLARGTKTPLTKDYGTTAVWAPDGKTIYYGHIEANKGIIQKVSAEGGGAPEKVLAFEDANALPYTSCRDGKTLLFTKGPISNLLTNSVWAMSLTGDSKPFQVIPEDLLPNRGSLSPDCKWLAFESRASGAHEISIISFPDASRRYQVSNSGGFDPKWSRDGKELFFYSPNESSIVSLPVDEKGQELALGKPTTLFHIHPLAPRLGVFEVSPDSKRFLVFGDTSSFNGTPLYIVTNWQANLAH